MRHGSWRLGLAAGLLCTTHLALADAPPDTLTLVHNAYGDTVWFQSASIYVGSRGEFLLPHNRHAMAPVVKQMTAWARTRGTPVLLVMEARQPAPTGGEIVARVLDSPRLGLIGYDPPNEWGIKTREAGRFDEIGGRPLDGWEVDFPSDDQRKMHFVFVVIGVSDSTVAAPLRQSWQEPWGRSRAPGDPVPIRTDRHPRPFDIPTRDRHLTARIVGEYVADLGRLRVERVKTSASRGR